MCKQIVDIGIVGIKTTERENLFNLCSDFQQLE